MLPDRPPSPPPWPDLPVAGALPELLRALTEHRNAVLVAPPGAGKTTLVPLALMEAPWRDGGRILVLEPRRLAARAAASRMSELLGEPVGGVVGYAMRFERAIGPDTVIEVVTEGLLVRRLQRDPELGGVAAVVFDEFHERSLDADLGLALCLDVQAGLRPGLRLVVMSATLDGAAVAALLGDAPIVRSEGRMHPVEVEHLGLDPALPFEQRMSLAVVDGLARQPGSVLAFLPGAAEIRRVQARLDGRTGGVPVLPLMGEIDRAAQAAAIAAPAAGSRKVVLATNIAETSLTIEGVGCVVDGGLERRPRFSARTGMTRLVTVPIARGSAEQRRGRAGRLGPGLCLRLGTAAEERARPEARPAEIEEADLAPLALDLAAWGAAASGLRWATPPPAAALGRAGTLLRELGAVDGDGRITTSGRAMSELPLHPRLARMLLAAGEHRLERTALRLAALLSAGPARGEVDLALRLRGALDPVAERVMRQLSRLLPMPAGGDDAGAVGAALALAYPDRVAQRRGGTGRYLLANGRGAVLDAHDRLAAEPWLVAAELDDRGSDARIRLAAAVDPAWLERLCGARMVESDELRLESGSVSARRVLRLGALEIHVADIDAPDPRAVAEVLLQGVLDRGLDVLPWTGAARSLRARLAFLHRLDPARFTDVGDHALAVDARSWLLPHLVGSRRLRDLERLDLAAILFARLGFEQRRELERRAPARVTVPSGASIAIDYGVDPPVLAVRLQEVLGAGTTPAVDDGRLPLSLHLLSPAGRPVAVTRDLPGFWATGYPQVRRELRGRYPKHAWPEEPLAAAPKRRPGPP